MNTIQHTSNLIIYQLICIVRPYNRYARTWHVRTARTLARKRGEQDRCSYFVNRIIAN